MERNLFGKMGKKQKKKRFNQLNKDYQAKNKTKKNRNFSLLGDHNRDDENGMIHFDLGKSHFGNKQQSRVSKFSKEKQIKNKSISKKKKEKEILKTSNSFFRSQKKTVVSNFVRPKVEW